MIRGLRALLVLLISCVSLLAHAEPLRIVVAVGHGQGLPGEAQLKYPHGDAQRIARVLQELGGAKKEQTQILLDPSVDQLNAALAKAQTMARARRPDEVSLVFFFSGHGDRDALHLGNSSVTTAELRRRIADVPAALRIVVTDACRTTESLRAKGMSVEAPFAVKLDEGVGARGIVWLHASGDGQAAQESDQLGSALFTHYWASGLRGAADRNGDGRVSLAESYEYAYHQTLLRSARSSGVLQRPEAQFDVTEMVPVVVTQPGVSSRIALPRDADTHYLVYAQGAHAVVAEAYGDANKSVEIAVTPGKYLVHRRAQGKGSATEFSLARREVKQLSAADFREVAEERLAKKGGELVLRPNEVDLAIGGMFGTFREPGYGARLGYFHNEGTLGFGARVGGFAGRSDAAAERLSLQGGDVRLLADARWRFDRFVLRAGVGAVGALLSQRRERKDRERMETAGYPIRSRGSALALGGSAFVAARANVGSVLYLELGVALDVLAARLDDPNASSNEPAQKLGALVAGQADLALGLRF